MVSKQLVLSHRPKIVFFTKIESFHKKTTVYDVMKTPPKGNFQKSIRTFVATRLRGRPNRTASVVR